MTGTRHRKRYLTPLVLLLAACSGGEEDVTMATTNDDGSVRIVYGDAPQQFGDLYLPDEVAPRLPVVVLVHGGFWRAQYGLDLMVPLAEDLVDRGYAVWNIEYRRVGQEGGGYPGTLDDVAAAVDQLTDIARDHSLDVGKVGIVGHSAGGHLALWAAGAGLEVVPVIGIGQGAVVDLRLGAAQGLGQGAVVDFLGGTPDQVPEAYDRATPDLTAGPSMVSVVGSDDDIVPADFSVMSDLPGALELVPVIGADHFDLIDPTGAAWAAVVDELDNQLRSPTAD